MTLWAIIPVKERQLAKSRLAAVLSLGQRVLLIEQLLLNVLQVVGQAASIATVLVVSRDTAVRQLAEQAGHQAISEEEVRGLNGAIRVGLHTAAQHHATRALILPADLPFLQLEDVLTLASADPVALCGDRTQEGTNALLLPTASRFQCQFGRHSFQQHQLEAKRCGLPLHILNLPRVQFDLDTPADWLAYQRLQMKV